ncbi:MAG: hypothetical protein IJ262_08470 [Clostridia bacterium]|nr:hypothetical protein [Clostridia bacterium]
MEEENQVFGLGAENTNKLDSEEEFSIYHNREEEKNNIDISAKELTDFVDSLIQDVPDISDEEINKGIENIIQKAYPAEEADKPTKNGKAKKVTLRVLFIAALLSIFSFSCLFVVGSSHNINIKNGFVTFAKDTVKIVFFGEEKEESIDVKTLMEDLELHGFKDILLPQKLYSYKSSVPVYSESVKEIGANSRVNFKLYDGDVSYSFKIEKVDYDELISNYFADLDNVETIVVDDLYIYVFEYDSGWSCIHFLNSGYDCLIQSEISLSEMINTAQTIIKTEE